MNEPTHYDIWITPIFTKDEDETRKPENYLDLLFLLYVNISVRI